MCARYTRSFPPNVFAQLVRAATALELPPAYNVCPSNDVLVARTAADGGRELALLHWGLVPHWSQGPDPKYAMINARADSVATKPSYRDAFKRQRCLIAADGFYEWRPMGKLKQPYYFRLRGGQPFAFAGVWDRWERDGQAPIESVAIITCAANALVAGVHDRMPVIIPPKHYDLWLERNIRGGAALESLLKPYPDTLMEMHPVSRAVNSPTNDSAQLIEPLAAIPPP